MERIHRSAKFVLLVVLATLSLGWTSAAPVLADVPDPTELRALPREGALVVRWSVTSTEGLVGFRVRYRQIGSQEWSDPIERPASARGVKISGLEPQPYQVRVRALLDEGLGGSGSVIGTPLPLGGPEEEPPEEEGATHLWGATSHGTRRWASSAADVKTELAKLQAAGATLVRTDLDWGEAEPTRGTISSGYRERLTLFLNEAAARGIKVLATLEDTPAWASPGGAWNDSPSNPETMGRFARWLTTEYGSKLVAVAVWNEPLNPGSPIVCPNGEARAVCYTDLVKAVFKGAREGNPAVKVLAGSVGPVDGPKFISEMWANGAKGYYDGWDIHNYEDNTANTVEGAKKMHEFRLAHGDNTPEWLTEFGWFTGTAGGAVSEVTQAFNVLHTYLQLASLSYIAGATVYQLRDGWEDPGNPEANFGLLRADFTQRLAYAAFAEAMAVK